jgi:hypothetical protein
MGKRSGGLNFYDAMRQKRSVADETQRAEENIQQAVTGIANKQFELETPTDTLREAVPQATPVAEEPIIPERGPSPENLARADLTTETDIQPSAAALQEIRQMELPKVSQDLFPEVQGKTTPEEAEALYTEQLQDESIKRAGMDTDTALLFGEYVDLDTLSEYNKKAGEAEDDGLMSLKAAMDAGGKSVQLSAGQSNIFGKRIDLSADAISEADVDPQGVLKKNSDLVSYTIKGYDKLNMLEDPADPTSEIRPEVGRAMVLATILELSNRIKLQDKEVDKIESERQYDSVLDREDIGKAIGSRVVRLLYPTQMSDPTQEFTGETEKFGYDYGNITEKERSALGQVVAQGFADSPLFDWIESYDVELPDGRYKKSFRTTRTGDRKLAAIRKSALKALGMSGKDRPVSLVPTDQGRLRGEGAYTQKEITSAVEKNFLTPKAKEAIASLSTVAHTVSPHKLLLMAGMMSEGQINKQSILSKYTKQDSNYFAKKEAEILKEYLAREKSDPSFTPQSLGFDTMAQAATSAALKIADSQREIRLDTMLDGLARVGQAFYYGYTAINNSSRLMISNTELNYQSDKVARFIVDGAKPAVVRKGSNSSAEKGFFRVLARSIIPDAESMTDEEQVARLKEPKEYAKYVRLGDKLLDYTTANAQLVLQPNEAEISNAPPLQLDSELEQLLAEHGKDAFYFTLDALHELARYNKVKDGDQFKTRVKAEVDGNSNGATIQAYQMGVENILKRGGVLYQDVTEIEGDIRDDVFSHMMQAQPELVKEPDMWVETLAKIKSTRGKVKELMKLPIMTSIYGKDPKYHGDTAKRFVQDNPELFSAFDKPEADIIKDLTLYLEVSLTNGLGGALEHARMAKRIGRAFNLANKISIIEGANGFNIQAGGFEYINDSPSPLEFEFGPGTNRKVAKITTKQRVPSATVAAKGVKLETGMISDAGLGSKLRNQLAVNSTQNIDATVAQETVTDVINRRPEELVMQVYDAFMGDSNSFVTLKDTANAKFKEVNERYNMLEKELESFQKLKAQVKADVQKKMETGGKFDIGLEGEYKSMGDLLFRTGAIITRDMDDGSAKDIARSKNRSRELAAIIKRDPGNPGYSLGAKSLLVTPQTFDKMFTYAIEMLNIENDLKKMIFETNRKRDLAFSKVRKNLEQYT